MDNHKEHHMNKRALGRTGIHVSPIGLGTVKFGRNQGVKYPHGFDLPTEEALADLLALAKNLGINVLDTAPAYGESESRLGRLLTGQRDDWVIIGKAGEEFENGQSTYIFTPDHFERSLERSLKRLKTDYLDVFLIHSNGEDLDILNNAPLIKKLHDLKSQGLVKAVGASTKTTAGGLKALSCLDVVMAMYTPDYTDEQPVLDKASETGQGIILKKLLSSGHTTNIKTAMNFAFAHPAVNTAIIGTINPDHLKQNVQMIEKILHQ